MSESNRLLIFSEALGGGVYGVIKDQVDILASKFDICLAYSPRQELPDGFENYFRERGITLLPLRMTRDFSLLNDIFSVFNLLRVVLRVRPDVIHLHSSKVGFIGRVIYPIFYIAGIKVFYTPHCYAFLNHEFSASKRKLLRGVEWFCSKLSTGTIACGESEHNIASSFGRSVLVRNGICDLEDSVQHKADTRVVIASVGRDSMQKNPDMFMRLAKELPEERFIWIGGYSAPGIPENVHVTGWITREEALSYIASSDIYVQCSLWEGLSISQLEAMSLSKPLLAYDRIGTRDPVVAGKNGFVFKNDRELLEYTQQLVLDSDLRTGFGRASRALFQENYTLENYLALEGIYTK